MEPKESELQNIVERAMDKIKAGVEYGGHLDLRSIIYEACTASMLDAYDRGKQEGSKHGR